MRAEPKPVLLNLGSSLEPSEEPEKTDAWDLCGFPRNRSGVQPERQGFTASHVIY